MMRSTATEDAVLAALRDLTFLEDDFEAGLLSQKDAPYLSCSPDGITLLKKEALWYFSSAASSDAGPVHSLDNTYIFATVEIKKRVAASLLGRSVTLSTSQLVQCEAEDAQFQTLVPKEHMALILHQLLGLASLLLFTFPPPRLVFYTSL